MGAHQHHPIRGAEQLLLALPLRPGKPFALLLIVERFEVILLSGGKLAACRAPQGLLVKNLETSDRLSQVCRQAILFRRRGRREFQQFALDATMGTLGSALEKLVNWNGNLECDAVGRQVVLLD